MQKLRNTARVNPTTDRQMTLALRLTRDGVIPNSIESLRQLTVDAATKVALTSAGVKLVIEMDTTGTRVFLADQRTSQIVGGPQDLGKLTNIRSFVAKERKTALGVEVAQKIQAIAFRASISATQKNPDYIQKSLENTYGPMLRPYLVILDRLQVNLNKLNDNENDTLRDVFEPILRQYFVRIKNAYFAHIVLLTKGQLEKGQLNSELFARGVPDFVHTRLTSNNLILERKQELARVLFPSDPAKGLALTVQEWRSSEFRERTPVYLLRASDIVSELVLNDKFIKIFCDLKGKDETEISLDDETNTVVARLLKSKVLVMPPMKESRYVTEPGSKNKPWRFPTPSLEAPQGAMSALGYALMRIYCGNLQTVDLVSDYYSVVAANAVRKELVTPTNNFYVQWANAETSESAWIGVFSGSSVDKIRSSTWRWLRMELRLSERGEKGNALREALLLSENLKVITTEVSTTSGSGKERADVKVFAKAFNNPKPEKEWNDKPATGLDDLLAKPDEIEIVRIRDFANKFFPKKIGKEEKAGRNNQLTTLGPEAKEFISDISKLSKPLAPRMSTWFRGFSEQRLQVAAVKLAKAQFDELFVDESIDDDNADFEQSESESEN